MLSSEEQKGLLSLARGSIASALSSKGFTAEQPLKENFSEKRGCFVTLKKSGMLRGCIGFPYPIMPLWEAVAKAAVAAALEDPRFPPVSEDELKGISIEISVLGQPEELKDEDKEKLPEKITKGKHGLIVKKGFYSGLLLPQVAEEFNFSPKQFLEEVCLKAGLPRSAWLEKGTRIYRFEAVVFGEE